MKKLTLAAILSLSLTACVPCFGQDVHCISVDDSRWLHEQALKVVYQDSLLNVQDQQINLLEYRKDQLGIYYEDLLKLEREKTSIQKEITADMVRFSESWQSEAEYYQKRSKKFRRQRNGLGMGIIAVVVLALI